MGDPLDIFAAIAEGLATCSALAGERPVRDVKGTDVTDDLLADPAAGIARLEWAVTAMRDDLAAWRAISELRVIDEDVARVQRLGGLIAEGWGAGSGDIAIAARECIEWWDRLISSTSSA